MSIYVGDKRYASYIGDKRRKDIGSEGGSSSLPSGYTQVEYIESNTQPYMTTDYKPRNTDVITVKFVLTVAPANANNYYVLFGSRNNALVTSTENAWIGINASRQLFVRFGTVNISQTITLSLNTEYTAIIDLVNCSITIAGNSYSFAGSNVNPSRSVYISKMNASDVLGTAGTARYLAFEVKRNGAQYINYVPAKVTDEAGNKGGFYDTVNQNFKRSALSSHEYTAGPAV